MARQDFSVPKHAAHGQRSGGGTAAFLIFLGFLLTGFGLALTVGPQYSWKVSQFAASLAKLGIQGGAFIVGGLSLFGVGLVGRSLSKPAAPEEHVEDGPSEFQLFSEQLATKIAQMRTSMLQISEDVTALAANQQAHFMKQSEDVVKPDHGQDAIFRLAASLDKLNAHVDERIHALDLQVRSGLETVANLVQDTHRMLGRRSEGGAPGGAEHMGQSGGGQAPIDFFETLDKLDAMGGGAQPGNRQAAPQKGRQPQAPFPSQSQGGEALDVFMPEDHRRRP